MRYFHNINQDVKISTSNNSTATITAGNAFVGTGESTLNVAGIQINLYSSTDCIIYCDQSTDNINWNITDSYNYYVLTNNFSVTVQATAAYFRIRVWNYTTNDATTIRLQCALCPIVEALPRSLNEDGHLKVSVYKNHDIYGWGSENTPMGEIRTSKCIKLVGTTFEGSTLDTSFWTPTVTLGATASLVSGELIMYSGTYSTGTASVVSVRRGRYNAGSANRFRSQVGDITTPTDGNVRRFGPFDGSNGAFFLVNGATFSVATRKDGVDTIVPYTHFSKYRTLPTLTNINTYEIYWTNKSVYYSINDRLVHQSTSSTSGWSSMKTFPISLENVNSIGGTTHKIKCLVATISRLGELDSERQYRYLPATGTYIVKSSAGRLNSIINGDNVGSIAIYDNSTGGATNQIGLIDT